LVAWQPEEVAKSGTSQALQRADGDLRLVVLPLPKRARQGQLRDSAVNGTQGGLRVSARQLHVQVDEPEASATAGHRTLIAHCLDDEVLDFIPMVGRGVLVVEEDRPAHPATITPRLMRENGTYQRSSGG
jgi:hypothetical protein